MSSTILICDMFFVSKSKNESSPLFGVFVKLGDAQFRITNWQWSAAELPVRVHAIV
jgi:hypothetical protein